MDRYTFRIAALTLIVEADREYIPKNMWDFIYEEDGTPDIEIIFRKERMKEQTTENELVRSAILSIFECDDCYLIKYNRPVLVDSYSNQKEDPKTIIYLNDGEVEHMVKSEAGLTTVMYSIRDAFFFHMQKLQRIAVHAASFVYKERAWLCSALSGTGKSTHVAMWHENGFPIEDFNGDIVICYMRDGSPMAASSPWCGTSGIYCNRQVPLGGVMFIERANRNNIKMISLFEGIVRLSARCLTPNWNKKLMESNINIIKMLIPKVKYSVLQCCPNTEAALVAKKWVDKSINVDTV